MKATTLSKSAADGHKSQTRHQFLQRKPGGLEGDFITTSVAPTIQPKLMVNAPGDRYEQEADAMADRVMRMPESKPQSLKPTSTGLIARSIQRKCASCEAEEENKKKLMRKAESSGGGFAASPGLVSQLSATRGGGSPLPERTRSFMENAFSTDFSGVRVHADGQAADMSRGIQAKAFTYGSDIYFNAGEFAPESDGGKRLLAHELGHVVQQRNSTSIQRSCETYPPREKTDPVLEAVYRRRGMLDEAKAIYLCRLLGCEFCSNIVTRDEIETIYDAVSQRQTITAKDIADAEAVTSNFSPSEISAAATAGLIASPVAMGGTSSFLGGTAGLAGTSAGTTVVTGAAVATAAILVLSAAAVAALIVGLIGEAKIAMKARYLRRIGFVVLIESPLAVCIGGCHVSPTFRDTRIKPDPKIWEDLVPLNPPSIRLDKWRDPKPYTKPLPRSPVPFRPPDHDTEEDRRRGCRGFAVGKRGGHACHDSFATKLSGTTREWRVVNPQGISIDYDGLGRDRSTLYEAKTGYRFLLNKKDSIAKKETIRRFHDQAEWQQVVANQCGYRLVWVFNDKYVADLIEREIPYIDVKHEKFDCKEDCCIP